MIFECSDELIINSVSEELVIFLDSNSLNLFEINSCGMAIYTLFDGRNSYNDVLTIIKERCNKLQIDFNEATFQRYVDELQEYSLLKNGSDKNPSYTEIQREWNIKDFNPEVKLISDMSEGFFSKVHVE